MDTLQINNIMNKYISNYLGTFAIDKLPKKVKYPSGLIVNNQESNKPGQHWVAIYFDKNKNAIFFDSYGQKAQYYGLNKYLKRHSKSIIENNKMIQSETSNYCGIYSILFIYFMNKNNSLRTFLSKFDIPKKNDKLIKKILKI